MFLFFRKYMKSDLELPPLGGEGLGGPVLTRTLLISALTAGGTDGGPRLIARDKATGEIVGSVDLPAGAIGTPMTYYRAFADFALADPRHGEEFRRYLLDKLGER